MAKFTIRVLIIIGIMLTIFFSAVVYDTPFFMIYNLAPTINASQTELKEFASNNALGHFVTVDIDDKIPTSTNSPNNQTLTIKLFNIFTLKTIKVNTEDIDLYVGGDIVGFSLNGDGVIVISWSKVESENGNIDTIKNSDIKKGDIIKEIEDEPVRSVADICRIVNSNKDKQTLNVLLERNHEQINTTISPAYDNNSKLYKLGLWVKDDASGIGTLTYIRADNNRFGALGHAICDSDTNTKFEINSGEMYNCSIIGLKKGVKGRAGELKGLFMQGKNNIGLVDKNTDCGVFGEANQDSTILKNKEILKAGGRLSAKPGKAYIRTAIDGKTIKNYEIEIVKTNYQSTKNEKSMVIKVTDKELIQKTGGIIQGMSGSPIIQNGKIIGAVTHVFVNDPSKGFGIYLDWMINQ